MARELSAHALEYVERLELATVNLVRIQTYSDRAASTESTLLLYSDRDVTYMGDVYEPAVARIGNIVDRIDHIPTPGSFFDRVLDFELFNRKAGAWLGSVPRDSFLWNDLRRLTGQLENATVEVWQLLTPDSPQPADLSGYADNSHVVFYRGRIARVGPVGDTIRFACELNLPEMSWGYVTDDQASKQQTGKRLPIVVGSGVERLAAVHAERSPETTLSQTIPRTDSSGDIYVADISQFDQTGTVVRVGSERFDVTFPSAPDATFMSFASRNSAQQARHEPGEPVVQIAENERFVLSSIPERTVSSAVVSATANQQFLNKSAGTLVAPIVTQTAPDVSQDSEMFDGRETAYLEYGSGQLDDIRKAVYSGASGESETTPATTVSFITDSFSTTANEVGTDYQSFNTGTGKLESVAGATALILKLSGSDIVNQMSSGQKTSTVDWWQPKLVFYKYITYPNFSTGTHRYYANMSSKNAVHGWSLNAKVAGMFFDVTGTTVSQGNVTWYGYSKTPPAGTVAQDIADVDFHVFWLGPVYSGVDDPPSGTYLDFVGGSYGIGMQMRLGEQSDVDTTAFFGSAVGYEMSLFCDVDGGVPTNTNYEEGGTDKIRYPASVIRWTLEEAISGGPAVDFASYLAAIAAKVGSGRDETITAGVDLGKLGTSLGEIISGLAWNYRTSIVLRERLAGSYWFLFQATSTAGGARDPGGDVDGWVWPEPIATLGDGEFQSYELVDRGLREYSTEHRFYGSLDPSAAFRGNDLDPEWRRSVKIDATTSQLFFPSAADMAATETLVGSRAAPEAYLPGWPLPTYTASDSGDTSGFQLSNIADVASYYAYERARVAGSDYHVIRGIPWYGGAASASVGVSADGEQIEDDWTDQGLSVASYGSVAPFNQAAKVTHNDTSNQNPNLRSSSFSVDGRTNTRVRAKFKQLQAGTSTLWENGALFWLAKDEMEEYTTYTYKMWTTIPDEPDWSSAQYVVPGAGTAGNPDPDGWVQMEWDLSEHPAWTGYEITELRFDFEYGGADPSVAPLFSYGIADVSIDAPRDTPDILHVTDSRAFETQNLVDGLYFLRGWQLRFAGPSGPGSPYPDAVYFEEDTNRRFSTLFNTNGKTTASDTRLESHWNEISGAPTWPLPWSTYGSLPAGVTGGTGPFSYGAFSGAEFPYITIRIDLEEAGDLDWFGRCEFVTGTLADVDAETTGYVDMPEPTWEAGGTYNAPKWMDITWDFSGNADYTDTNNLVKSISLQLAKLDSGSSTEPFTTYAINQVKVWGPGANANASSVAYGWEVGDIIRATPPWDVGGGTTYAPDYATPTPTKLRLLEVVKNFDTELIDIKGIEVD